MGPNDLGLQKILQNFCIHNRAYFEDHGRKNVIVFLLRKLQKNTKFKSSWFVEFQRRFKKYINNFQTKKKHFFFEN